MSTSRPETAATSAADRPAATGLVESDVEAPEVFQRTEAALWDGRPSLGGVWVAHPDVTDPERVIIRNTANGQTVIGALFRRERENPGPRIQVSSDAAAALGLIAGAPTQLDVTALKRTEPKAEEEAPAEAATETVVAEGESAPEADAVAGASAAIARAETEGTTADTATADGTASAGTDVAAAEPETPRRRGFLAGLFGAKKVSEPLSATSAAGTTALDAPDVTTAALDAPAVDAAPIAAAPAATITPAAPAATVATEQVLADPQIVAPATEPEPRRRGGFLGGLFGPRESAPLSALDPTVTGSAEGVVDIEDAEAPAPATRGSYLEVGVFPSRRGADSAAADMREAGIIPLIDQRETADTDAWRVLVGPATSREDRAALLHKVKGLGYEDAAVVSR